MTTVLMTQRFGERPSMLPASVAFRVQPLLATAVCRDRAGGVPFVPTSVRFVGGAAATAAAAGPAPVAPAIPVATATPVVRRLAVTDIAGKGRTVSAAKNASTDQTGTKHNYSKNVVTNVDRMTGVGGDPPRGRPN
ncbi:MAG: hypothetical protein ACRDT4_24985 [Micromonosporaceae bacterium]